MNVIKKLGLLGFALSICMPALVSLTGCTNRSGEEGGTADQEDQTTALATPTEKSRD